MYWRHLVWFMLENLKWFLIVFNCCGVDRGEEVAVLPGTPLAAARCGHYFTPRTTKTQQMKHCNAYMSCLFLSTYHHHHQERVVLTHSVLTTDVISQEVGYNLGFQPGLAEINKKWSLSLLSHSNRIIICGNFEIDCITRPIKKYSHLVLKLLIGPSGKISRNKYLSDL